MKHTLNQLIQVQDLNFALAEQKASHPEAKCEQLEKSIQDLVQKLPQDLAHRYRLLRSRVPVVVVPITRGGCSGCGMAVPLALINQVRAVEQVQACPHCGRFLFYQEVSARRIETPGAKRAPTRVGIVRFSSKDLMVPKLAAKTSEEAIAELVDDGSFDDRAAGGQGQGQGRDRGEQPQTPHDPELTHPCPEGRASFPFGA